MESIEKEIKSIEKELHELRSNLDLYDHCYAPHIFDLKKRIEDKAKKLEQLRNLKPEPAAI